MENSNMIEYLCKVYSIFFNRFYQYLVFLFHFDKRTKMRYYLILKKALNSRKKQ